MDSILLQDQPQFVGIDPSLIQDRLRQSGAEDLARVDGHRHSTASIRVPQLYVGATLHDHEPAEAPECADKLRAG